MWIGFIVASALLAIVIVSLLARVKPVLPVIALLWAIALPVIGIAQLHVMPGSGHWVIQVIHLILGLGAIGLGEALAKRALLPLHNE
jgi:Na+/phosphate symporter